MAMNKPTCKIDGCEKGGRITRGWCGMHYQAWRAHGDPRGGRRKYATPEEAFAARTEWQGDCLIWTGADTGRGYGRITVNGKLMMAHRYAWEREHGPIPDGMEVDHKDHCDTLCVNAKHLRLATRSQNCANRNGPELRNSSGHRNVHFNRGRWVVEVKRNNTVIGYGAYASLEEAARVATRAREDAFGEFAGRG